MRYLFGKACKKLRVNIRKYVLFMIQIAIGVCMIALSLNIKFTFQQKFEAFQEKVDNQYVNVSASPFYGNSPDALPKEDYEYIRTYILPDEKLISYYRQYGIYDKDGLRYMPILFVDENFYQLVMKAQNYQETNVYVGMNAQNMLDSTQEFEGGQSRSFYNPTDDTLFGVPISSFIPLAQLEYSSKALLSDASMSDIFAEQTFEDYVIFPLSVLESLDKQPTFDIDSLAITLMEDEQGAIYTPVQEIVSYLQRTHVGESYSVENFYKFAEENLNKDRNIAAVLDVLSAFILLIVAFGFMGLLFVLINRRNKEFAISLMNGATIRQLTLEIYVEILCVVMFGVLLGSFLSVPLLPFVDSSRSGASFHWQTLVILILGGMAMSAIICMLSLLRLKYITPVSVLKNE